MNLKHPFRKTLSDSIVELEMTWSSIDPALMNAIDSTDRATAMRELKQKLTGALDRFSHATTAWRMFEIRMRELEGSFDAILMAHRSDARVDRKECAAFTFDLRELNKARHSFNQAWD